MTTRQLIMKEGDGAFNIIYNGKEGWEPENMTLRELWDRLSETEQPLEEMLDRSVLKCAQVTACPNCERKGVISNMRKDVWGVFKCETCGMEIDTNKLEERSL